MEIIKSKRKSECNIWGCDKKIDSKYKVKEGGKTYHLSCYYRWLKRIMERKKLQIKEFSKGKYKRIMMLENLK